MALRDYGRYPLKTVAFEAAIGAMLVKASERFLRKRLGPTLPEIAAQASHLFYGPEALLAARHCALRDPDTEADIRIQQEHRELADKLQQRYGQADLRFPGNWAVEKGTALLLYALVRILRPETVIEIGVGNGESSYFILNALLANSAGRLYSFDIERNVGQLVGQREQQRWELRMLERRNSQGCLAAELTSMPPFTLCFHDGDHGYLGQYRELTMLWRMIEEGGVMISDDVDASYGFLDFCATHLTSPAVLLDKRKSVGLVSSRTLTRK